MVEGRSGSGTSPRATLTRVLEESRDLGFLGPGPVGHHVDHALAMARFAGPPSDRVLDLGAGGGVPGLVLTEAWPDSILDLLDSVQRRTAFLRRAVEELGCSGRARVLEGRAEVLGRGAAHREQYELVLARGFGSPAVTAECAVGFLREHGRLVVSEPPDPPAERWPPNKLRQLGLVVARRGAVGGSGFVELRRDGPLDDRWPRRTGVPRKRPLW
jgi:16S rRNA (guanine527-N7)-methyltransferase